MRPTVLLTGGFGNLGGRIAAALHQDGKWRLRLASRTHKLPPPWAPHASVIHLDLLNPAEIDTACNGVQAVIHLAALNDRDALHNPQLAEKLSGNGTRLLADAAVKNGVERFLYMSTAHVYGSPIQGTITEDSPTLNKHPYSSSHLSGEQEVFTRHQNGDLKGIIFRCANGFGVPMDQAVDIWHVLVNDLCRQIVSKRSITLLSNGLQERNFIPIADVCSAYLHFLTLDTSLIGNGIFNLGSRSSKTVLQMAVEVASRSSVVLGVDPPIHRPETESDDSLAPLDYRIDKLLGTGFSPANNINYEIDHLLMMCRDMVQ